MIGQTEGNLTCGKCGGDVVLMEGDYIFGVGFDCPTCTRKGE